MTRSPPAEDDDEVGESLQKKKHKQYYVKWEGFGPEHSDWLSAEENI
jgi:hypothetical protein